MTAPAPRTTALSTVTRRGLGAALLLAVASLSGGCHAAAFGHGYGGLVIDDSLARQAADRVNEYNLRTDLTALVSFGTRHTRSETESDSHGIGAARRWLHARLEDIAAETGDRLVVESQSHRIPAGRRMPVETEVVNVVATLPGSDAGRVLIVSGHYDSRNGSDDDITGPAPGANDDGSGTVAVLEMARAITATLGGRMPRASIRFACVAGEEQGLYGSRAMAAVDRDAGTDVVAMLTNDIVGGVGGGNGKANRGRIRLFSEGVPSSDAVEPPLGSDNDATSRQVARYIKEVGAAAVPQLSVELVLRQDRYLRGGDHKAYNEQGYAGVRFTDMHEHFDRQHQDVRTEGGREYGDTLEHIDFANLADVTRLNAAALVSLALAPPSPSNVRMDISGLSNDTRLMWDDPEDPAVAGYRIRARVTASPVWQQSRDVGLVHEHVLEGLSKDDMIFAVEAYDHDGRPSLPVYPRPGR